MDHVHHHPYACINVEAKKDNPVTEANETMIISFCDRAVFF